MVDSDEHEAVLAPTHFIRSGQDPWIPVDEDLTHALRDSLDRARLRHVRIYYPLITNTTNFHSVEWRQALIDHLRRMPIDAVWLRIHRFGTTNSGPHTLKRHLAACRDLHQLGLPLVGEHTGSVGVALMAFGAVGGIESGVTVHEGTDLRPFLRPPTKQRGGNGEARVYLHELGTFLARSKAAALLNRPGMKAAHACLDTACCRRGWKDTQSRYREHFVTRRVREVAALSNIPEPLRAGSYMENFLRPASDKAVRAAEAEPALLATRKRLDSWRGTLGADLTSNPAHSFSPPAAGKLHRKTA